MSQVDKLKTFSRKQRSSKMAMQSDGSKSNEIASTGSQDYSDGVTAASAQEDPYEFLGTHAELSTDIQSQDSRGSSTFVFLILSLL